MKEISECIKWWMLVNEIPQKVLAYHLNCSMGKICTILRGSSRIALDDYLSICEALEVPQSFFLEGGGYFDAIQELCPDRDH